MLAWLLCVADATAAFPAADEWQPLTIGGAVVEDPLGDHQDDENSIDLLGTSTSSVASWFADSEFLFLRVQVADDPEIIPDVWGFLLDVDGDDLNFEFTIEVSGFQKDLNVLSNTGHVDGTWVPGVLPVLTAGFGDEPGGQTRVVQDTAKIYVDLQLSRANLQTYLGVAGDTPLRFAAFSTTYWPAGILDLGGCDGAIDPCDVLADVLSDVVYVDFDGDDLGDPQEPLLGTDPLDADSDDDGVPDGDEAGDVDGDGAIDALECDTDLDGLADGTEAGLTAGTAGTDAAGCFVPDVDPDSTTEPSVADTDGGGIVDGGEDADHDGAIGSWETDPNDPGDDLDSDGDGVPDIFDDLFGNGQDADSDGDGIDDQVEGLGNVDGDALPDFADTDSDGDGIDDIVEGEVDSDGDGALDPYDTDSDDDGLPDLLEGAVDTDLDGFEDFRDTDADHDGIFDEDEGTVDSDDDGTPDRVDTDSDDDGLLDREEGAIDSDGDEVPDYLDLDSDNDTWSDAIEGSPDEDGDALDTDHDGDEDFRDQDSDDDLILDIDESDGDVDCDGKINRLDGDSEDSFCDTGVGTPTVDDDEPPGPTGQDPDPFASPGQFTGGSCSVTPRGAPWWATALVALLWRRRQRARMLLVVAAAPLAPSTASAQAVDAERFAPSVDGGVLTVVEDAEVGTAGAHGLGLLVGYADDPFVFRPDEGEEVALLGAVATAHLTGWYSLGGAVVGAEIPVHLFTDGYRVDTPTHLGDVRVYGKVRVLHSGPVSAGPYLDLSLPTGAVAAWVGAGEAVANGGAIVTVRGERLLASANVGFQNGTGNVLGQLGVTPAVTWAAGLGLTASDAWSFAAEVDAEHWLSNPGLAGDGPIEALLTVHRGIGHHLLTTVGGGTGLSRGVGAPDFRLVGGLAWWPAGRDAGAPEATPTAVEPPRAPSEATHGLCPLVVRVIDPAGRPIEDAEIRVVGAFGDPLRTGPDGILEARLQAGDTELTVTADGWSTVSRTVALSPASVHDVTMVLAPSEVRIDREANQIFLVDKVFFEVNRTELVVDSLAALDGLVAVLLAHPEVRVVRIEGHTDATGDDRANLELSQGRAESVRAYLVKQGIAPERLEAKGLGESHPLQVGDSEEVYATNRRVEFHIASLEGSTGR